MAPSSWYYQHEGQTCGPVSVEEIKSMAAINLLGADDLIWPEGGDIKGAIPANTIVDFAGATQPTRPAAESSPPPPVRPPAAPATPPRPPAPRPAPASAAPTPSRPAVAPAAPRPAAVQPAVPSSPGGPVPDWLSGGASTSGKTPEVEPAPAPAPLPEVPGMSDSPEWLEDMRLWVGLDLLTAAPRQQAPEAPPTTAAPEEKESRAAADQGGTPGWLQEWLTSGVPEPEKPPTPAAPEVPLAKPVSPKRKKRGRSGTVPMAKPVARPSPAEAEPVLEAVEAVEAEGTEAEAADVEIVDAEVVATAPEDILAQQALQETGFDLKTGRVVDPVKFQKWKQQKAKSTETGQAGMTNASVMGVFREARIAIEKWVDDDKNRLRVQHGSIDEIKRNKEVQQIYVQYAGYGFRLKLEKHLEFLVENRKKYYKAMEKAGK